MSQLQKVGRMRDRVFNAHLSFNKYPEERRRSNSLKTERIKQCFNKSLLDWIDPPKWLIIYSILIFKIKYTFILSVYLLCINEANDHIPI